VYKWKINALNAMRNNYKDDYFAYIVKARNDQNENVRTMAEWVKGIAGSKKYEQSGCS
jgi:epoxyqueuosine reductase